MILNCFLLAFCASGIFSARILGIAPIPSYSHQIFFHSIWKELSLRGHQVVAITTNPFRDPALTNLTEIDTSVAYKAWQVDNFTNTSNASTIQIVSSVVNSAADMIEVQLEHSEIQNLIKNESEHFDILLVEAIYPAMYAFSERFKCPFIGITSADSRGRNYRILGNPNHPVLYVDFYSTFVDHSTLWNRLVRTYNSVYGSLIWEILTTYNQQYLVDKYFGEGLPELREIEGKMSLLFTNTDPIFHPIRPLLPNIIQIGGATHLSSSTKLLPKDLQEKLDGAKNGFIYFSLGSNVKSKMLSQEVRQIILDALSELPYLVLWKFELDVLPGKPDNVIISKWFPQKDIFKHPNVKLFVTQGGLQSMEEAIYSYVPIVGIPFFGDQPRNMKAITDNGMGLAIELTSISKDGLKSAILEVITNPEYKTNVRKMVELARDQPMTGLEKAVWWTEYVIRHKGAKHLKSPALNMPSYQYFMLDVIAVVLVTLGIGLFIIVKLIKLICKLIKAIVKRKSKIKTQ